MSESILDKVLSSKEDQEKQEFNPLEVINTLLKTLSTKEADVLRRRYGLSVEGKETLETIGSLYSVTRERIRQIENQSIQKMKAAVVFHQTMKPVQHLVISLLNNHGDIMSQEMMYESLLGIQHEKELEQRALSFIIDELLDDKVEPIPKNKLYGAGWRLQLASMDFVQTIIEALKAVIVEVNEPQSFDALFERFKQTDIYTQNHHKLTEDTILSYLDISSALGKNPFGDYGLTSWGLIAPKRMNDRVYLILEKEGQPMHFEDIAKQITKIFKKRAYPPTVHNELILNTEYVLVGRGIYALQEWGFKEGVVSAVIEDILRDAGKPLSRAEIVREVLAQRIVKKNTIHLALTDKHTFQKTREGLYTVVSEADKKKDKDSNANIETAVPASGNQSNESEE